MDDEDEDGKTDPRPPNPELEVTNEFNRMYGNNAMPHFRYFMTPPNGVVDEWTKAVLIKQQELKCIECGLADDKKSMRIPLQCVANDKGEYSRHRTKHRERCNDMTPCTQALHVGCARWGNPSSKVRKCYFFPGLTNQDGSIRDGLDTVSCIYCKNHAENVDDKHQKTVNRDTVLSEKKKAAQNDRLGEIQQRTSRSKKIIRKVLSSTKDRIQQKSKIRDKRPPVYMGKNKVRESERYGELNPSLAAINTGEQPTLAKRRRKIAIDNSKSRSADGAEVGGLPPPPVDREQKKMRIANTDKSISRSKNKNTDLTNDLDNDRDIDINLNSPKNSDMESSNDILKHTKSRGNLQKRQAGDRPPDRWSKLFIGQSFVMGHEFTIQKFGKKI